MTTTTIERWKVSIFRTKVTIFASSSCILGNGVDGGLTHHHLAELVEVHGPRAVLVDLLDDAVQIFLRQPLVQLRDDLTELTRRDETLQGTRNVNFVLNKRHVDKLSF